MVLGNPKPLSFPLRWHFYIMVSVLLSKGPRAVGLSVQEETKKMFFAEVQSPPFTLE